MITIKKTMTMSAVLILIGTLSACGFHLRGHKPLSLTHVHAVNLQPDTPYEPLYKSVKHALNAAGVKVHSHVLNEKVKAKLNAKVDKTEQVSEAVTQKIDVKSTAHTSIKKDVKSDITKARPLDIVLNLGEEKLDVLTLAYGPKGQIRRERLTMNLTYSVENGDGDILIPERTITTLRDRQLHPDQTLADAEEKRLLQDEMRKDVVSQLVYQLDSLLPRE